MCLWNCQICPCCGEVVLVRTIKPIPCADRTCFRQTSSDYEDLTDDQENRLLSNLLNCKSSCPIETCGLLCQFYYCGSRGALRRQCPYDSDDFDTDNLEWFEDAWRVGVAGVRRQPIEE